MITRINTEGLHKDNMETFYVEQADGTWHKMSLAEGVERNIKNAVLEGKYKTISNERMMEQRENRLKKDQFDFFMAKGEHGVPTFIWVEKIPD